MLLNQIQKNIFDLLSIKKTCAIREMYKNIDASNATVQRQLNKLEELGYISRIHGAVILKENRKTEHFFDIRMSKNKEKKQEISVKAVELIKDETSIFMDHSSTCAYLALEMEKRKYKHIVLVTNSIFIANKFDGKHYVDLVLAGGELQHSWSATKGPDALHTISRFHFDQAFISCGMFSFERGARTNYSFVAEIIRKACEFTFETNLLIDSSKFFDGGAFLIRKTCDITKIITDSNLDKKIFGKLKNNNINIL